MSNIVTDIVFQVDSALNQYIFTGYHAVITSFATPLTVLLVIYFAGLGWLVIRGLVPLTPLAVAWHMLRAAFIFTLALRWDYFSAFVVNFFTHGVDKLVTDVLNHPGQVGSAQTVTDSLAQIWRNGSNVFAALWRSVGADSLLGVLVGILGYSAVIGMVGLALFYLVMSKVALSVLLILAPIVLPLYLWGGSREIFNGWLRLLIQWMITPLFIYAFIALYIPLVSGQIHSMMNSKTGPTTVSISGFVLVAMIVMMSLKQASNMAVELARKIALHGDGQPRFLIKGL